MRKEKQMWFAGGMKKLAAVSFVAVATALSMKAQDGSVRLEWNQSTNPAVVAYGIYYGYYGPVPMYEAGDTNQVLMSSRTYTNGVIVVGVANTNLTITGLKAGDLYCFAAVTFSTVPVSPYNTGPCSPWSDEVLGTAKEKPAPPINLRIVGYNTYLETGRTSDSEAVKASGTTVPFSLSIWSTLDPLLDSKAGAVDVASRYKLKIGL